MWLDWWHPSGVLYEKYSFRDIYDADSQLDARLLTVLTRGAWVCNPARSDDLVEIQGRLLEVNVGGCNKPIWLLSKRKKYKTWEGIRIKIQLLIGGSLCGSL